MDIIRNLKQKRRKSGHGWEKPFQDKHTEDLENDPHNTVVEGKIIEMAPDVRNLPEFDWDDPKNQWFMNEMEEREAQRIRKYGRLTHKQMEEISGITKILLKKTSALTKKEAFDIAWKKVAEKNLLNKNK